MQKSGYLGGQLADYKVTIEDTEEIKDRMRQYEEIFEKFKSKGLMVQ